ncbi:hypothetical protein [Natranaerobius thermophilus]|uniref:Uncharacterized protein n=1 Tax=Natranaerobius thermophilus (strain ATCC BAA-1301 / DSM 18059 / JW/NM-WN-LF) TaxID=457570 RepID=B2A377_NATTJ|nr:hypothetical protein [Natranaerobius thermophilus]ACB85007.1 hypothetical protein Nther_1424 [Natranaerobius thermophilus JW/NM-WN-LF]
MSFTPGELHVLYSKMPEVSKINSQEQQMPNWHYYLIHSAFQREQHWNTKSVTESPSSSEDEAKTKKEDGEDSPAKQEQKVNNKRKHRKSRDSGRFVDITL